MTDEVTASNRDALITAWDAANKALKLAKENEAALRPQVIEALSEHDAAALFAGTERVDIGHGFEAKITHVINYTLDNANDYEKTDEALDAIEKLIGEALTLRLVKRKLELSISEYKKLSDLPNGAAAKKLIDAVITAKPGSKAVEIEKKK